MIRPNLNGINSPEEIAWSVIKKNFLQRADTVYKLIEPIITTALVYLLIIYNYVGIFRCFKFGSNSVGFYSEIRIENEILILDYFSMLK